MLPYNSRHDQGGIYFSRSTLLTIPINFEFAQVHRHCAQKDLRKILRKYESCAQLICAKKTSHVRCQRCAQKKSSIFLWKNLNQSFCHKWLQNRSLHWTIVATQSLPKLNLKNNDFAKLRICANHSAQNNKI